MLVVGVTGKKRSGKDAFSDALVKAFENDGLLVKKMAFAEPMKRVVASTLGVSLEELEEMKNLELPYTYMVERIEFFVSPLKMKEVPVEDAFERFSDALRRELETIGRGEDGEHIFRGIFANSFERATTARKLLQLFGTEGMKPVYGDDVWAKILLRRAEREKLDVAVVSDMRFPEERRSIASSGHPCVFVRVLSTERPSTEDTHASEALVDSIEVDYEFENDKSKGLEFLAKQAENVRMLVKGKDFFGKF